MKYYRYGRSWMYDRLYSGRRALKPHFIEGVNEFITWAFAQKYCRSEGGVRYFCLKCECRPIISDLEEVARHLHRRISLKIIGFGRIMVKNSRVTYQRLATRMLQVLDRLWNMRKTLI